MCFEISFGSVPCNGLCPCGLCTLCTTVNDFNFFHVQLLIPGTMVPFVCPEASPCPGCHIPDRVAEH